MKAAKPQSRSLRVTDQETARVVGILGEDEVFVGAGCLIDGTHILTCYHVIEAALGKKPKKGAKVSVKLVGMDNQPLEETSVLKLGAYAREGSAQSDLALLQLARPFTIPTMEFATPLRHSGKRYSVLGFPDGDPQGRNASGLLHAANAAGLVQMDGNSALFVKGGFSGAPVWSADLGAFVGIVVRELFGDGVAWCIPSRLLCQFFPPLKVKFRMPMGDRPVVHDYWEDDPNIQLFGTISDNGVRRLCAKIRGKKGDYKVQLSFEPATGAAPLRGGYVTFINYPDFTDEDEDAYELFAPIIGGKAETEIELENLFTVAAVGDAGDTALTLNLDVQWKQLKKKP